jgi:hypothetical protein
LTPDEIASGSRRCVPPRSDTSAADTRSCRRNLQRRRPRRAMRRPRPITEAGRLRRVKTLLPLVERWPRNPEVPAGLRHPPRGLFGVSQHPQAPGHQSCLLCFRHRVSTLSVLPRAESWHCQRCLRISHAWILTSRSCRQCGVGGRVFSLRPSRFGTNVRAGTPWLRRVDLLLQLCVHRQYRRAVGARASHGILLSVGAMVRLQRRRFTRPK